MKTATPMADSFGSAAYGGEGWSQRNRTHKEEIGDLFSSCGLDSEYRPLGSVLVHRPGPEMEIAREEINTFQFADVIDLGRARAEHDAMTDAYRSHGVTVHYLDPGPHVTPNQLYCADLAAMTPQGAILARPASTVRAGEERWMARTLWNLGVPVIKVLTGQATFEGADLMWLDPETAVVGRGLRTNGAGIEQVSTLLAETGVKTLAFDLPYGTMHFMGMMRIVDRDLAFVWPRRTPHGLVMVLEERGFQVAPLPDVKEAVTNMAFNFVVLGPKKIMMPDKNPRSRAGYEAMGIEVVPVGVDELRKAYGAMACMSHVLCREMGE